VALCRLGAREGVPALLEAAQFDSSVPLQSLNAVRSPAMWARLRDDRRPHPFYVVRDLRGETILGIKGPQASDPKKMETLGWVPVQKGGGILLLACSKATRSRSSSRPTGCVFLSGPSIDASGRNGRARRAERFRRRSDSSQARAPFGKPGDRGIEPPLQPSPFVSDGRRIGAPPRPRLA
jgi:hypothetical protein